MKEQTSKENNWPRIKDLPEEERIPFFNWLKGQTVPLIDNIPWEEQDGYFPWDYERWKARLPIID